MNEKEKKFVTVDPKEKAEQIASWLIEKKARDVLALDVSALSPWAETQIMATARGFRHAQALADWLLDRLGEARYEYMSMEGYKNAQWILVDCNDVVAHIFQETQRGYFNLEGLWAGAPVLFEQEAEALKPDDGDLD